MIEPSNIELLKESSLRPGVEKITARLQVNDQVIVYDREDEERCIADAKQRVWRAIYGDLESKLCELRRRVLPNVLAYAAQDVDKAIREIEAMVKSPF